MQSLKTGLDPTNLINYHSILNHLFLSRLFKCTVAPPFRSYFLPEHHSSKTDLLKVTTADSGAANLLIDRPEPAFATVHHFILLHKLYEQVIKCSALDWLTSLLPLLTETSLCILLVTPHQSLLLLKDFPKSLDPYY